MAVRLDSIFVADLQQRFTTAKKVWSDLTKNYARLNADALDTLNHTPGEHRPNQI